MASLEPRLRPRYFEHMDTFRTSPPWGQRCQHRGHKNALLKGSPLPFTFLKKGAALAVQHVTNWNAVRLITQSMRDLQKFRDLCQFGCYIK